MQFLETIKFENGEFKNLRYHKARVISTAGVGIWHKMEKSLDNTAVELSAVTPTLKCSIIYDFDTIISIKAVEYHRKKITRLIPVESDIDYSLKYADRTALDSLKQHHSEGEEPMIVKNGLITDTTFSNLLFKDRAGKYFTPRVPLLKGTMRAFLLEHNLITERDISISDLSDFTEAHLINAMNDIDDYVVPIEGKIH